MEHPIPLLVAVLALLLTFFALFRNRNKSVLPLPPGTTGWPILGENIEFFSMGRKNTPEKFIEERVHKYSSQVFMTSLIGQTVAVLCGQEGNKFIFSNEGNMLHSWWPKTVQNIFSVPAGVSFYEELHKTRLSIRVFLKPEKLNKSTQHMDSLTKLHVLPDLEHNGKVLSGCTLAKKYSFMTACRLFLSIQDQDHVAKLCDPFNRIMTGMMSLHINFPGLPYNRALKAKDYLRDEIMKIIVQRRKETSIDTLIPEDILSYMLMTNDEDRQFVNNDAITAVKMISMFLAHDSVNTVLSFTMKYLAELPNVYNQVLKEQREIAKLKQPGELLNLEDLQKMSYTWNVVNEVMRFAPTLQGTFSEATCDITYAGYSIPKGSKVHWNAFSTHKNPKYFPEPEKFDPSRFEGNGPAPYTFVPFGGGSRICPGMAYARCAILVFLHNLVTRYSWKKLNLDEKTFYDLIPRFACGLPIQLQPHEFVQDC